MKFDSSGNAIDTTQFFTPPYGNNLLDLIVVNDSDIYACGSLHNSWSADRTARVVKLNSSGDTIHTRLIPHRFTAYCIRHEPIQNLIIVAGFGYDSTQNYTSVHVTWLDTSLNIISVHQIDSTGNEHSLGFALNQTQIYISGYTSYPTLDEFQWIYLLDTSIISNLSDVNKNNSVFYFSNYSLYYFLGNERRGTIVFYDITGREMKKINLLENYGNVNVQNLPVGLYVSVLINYKKEIINAIKIVLQ